MDRVILVTGAARGIGKQIILNFANLGDKVVVNYNLSVKLANELEKELKSKGIDCLFVKADISKEEEVHRMVDLVMKTYGRIDVLVNNSAVTSDSLFHDKDANSFRRVLDVNLVGTFIVSKIVGNIMYQQKSGKIINLSSTNGINTYYPMCLEYDASKAGLNSLTHNLAIQFAPYITVNAIAPGFIATESEIEGMDEDFIKEEESKILLRRAGTEEDVANLVEFLASDKASFINNQIIKINGGMYGD